MKLNQVWARAIFLLVLAGGVIAEVKEPETVAAARKAIKGTNAYFESAIDGYEPTSKVGYNVHLSTLDWRDKVPSIAPGLSNPSGIDRWRNSDWVHHFDCIGFEIAQNAVIRKKKAEVLGQKPYIPESVKEKMLKSGMPEEQKKAKMEQIGREKNPKLYAIYEAIPKDIETIDAQLVVLTNMLYDLQAAHSRWAVENRKREMLEKYKGMDIPLKKIELAEAIKEIDGEAVEAEKLQTAVELETLQEVLEDKAQQVPEVQEKLEKLSKAKEAYKKANDNSDESMEITAEQLNDSLVELFSDAACDDQDDFKVFNESLGDDSKIVKVESADPGQMKVVDTEATQAFKAAMAAMGEASDLGGDIFGEALDSYSQMGDKMADAATNAANKWVTRGEEVHNVNFTRASELFESQGKTPSEDTHLEFNVEGETVTATVDHWRPVNIDGQMFYLAEDSLGNPSGLLIKFESEPKWVIFSDEKIEVYHTDPSSIEKTDTEYTAMANPTKIQSIVK